jgi:ABC-2 type transport system permease protein
VIVDRKSGAQPDLLAAPIPRPFLVLANLLAALVASGLQLAALVTFSILRGATFHASVAGMAWFAGAAVALAVATYGIAETMANRIGEEEEYVNTIPTIGIAPWFFAGSLFSIHALPSWLTLVAKLLPVTHAVALMPARRRPARHPGTHRSDRHGRVEPQRACPLRRRLHVPGGAGLHQHDRPLTREESRYDRDNQRRAGI